MFKIQFLLSFGRLCTMLVGACIGGTDGVRGCFWLFKLHGRCWAMENLM